MYLEVLFCTITYSPGYTTHRDLIVQNWDLLKCSSATKILAETRLIFGKRRLQNFKDILVRAKIPKPISEARKPCSKYLNRCNNLKCVFCPMLNKSGRIISTRTGCEYECKRNITCKSNNLIYCITCKTCKKQYVGQTGDSIHKRFSGHIGSIRRKKTV